MKSLDEKTEAATPKRLQKLRSKGSVAKSQDFSTALMLLFGALILYFLGGSLVWDIKHTMTTLLRNAYYDKFDVNALHSLFINISSNHLKSVLSILGGFMIIGIIGSFAQTGFVYSPKAIVPDFKKLNPITGIKNLVSKKALVKVGMALVKLTIMGTVAYFSVRKDIEPLMELVTMRVEGIFSSASNLIFGITLKITIILLILSLIDFIYQRWQFSKDSMMTKHEVKQESKQSEGDPLIKSRIRTAQRQMSNQRMMSEVPDADVIVTNPTHYAVALKYDAAKMNSPKVVAKGIDFLALKIIEIAKDNHVPVVEDRILARMLYNTVEVDGEIPSNLYKAVAKVLSYVYQLRNIIGRQN